jgi:hypothetical protein
MNIVAKTGRLMEVSEIHMTNGSLDWLLDVAERGSLTWHDAHAAVHDLAPPSATTVSPRCTLTQHDALASLSPSVTVTIDTVSPWTR